jgi:hypothetical protein
MSSAPLTTDDLIARFRRALDDDIYLTHRQAATEIGVSLRTISNWANTDTEPQKRYRRQLADWLESRNGGAS